MWFRLLIRELLYRWYHVRQGLRRAGGGRAISHIQKRRILRECARDQGLHVLVETGTFYGDMVAALRHHFDEIHSIELGRDLYERAVGRLGHLPGVHLHHGDSAAVLPDVIARLSAPALFWLDAHYSGGPTARGTVDTPIAAELDAICRGAQPGSVILIDDARLYTGASGYPDLREVEEFVRARAPNLTMCVRDDVVRLTPSDGATSAPG